jgi:isopentenyl diphosphate isomerase/L-lactate dehydrogenase-like FMN-dependent dehydrogenase
MPGLKDATSIEDYASLARRRLPGFAFDFLDGGVGAEHGLRRNLDAFERSLLMPRYMSGVTPECTTTLFGKSYAMPFGIAPTGMANLMRANADRLLAELALQHGIPFVLSATASTSLECVADPSGGNTWFQVYLMRDDGVNAELCARAWSAGVRVLVVTVDTPTSGNRLRRSPYGVRLRPSLLLEIAAHPAWALRQWAGGPLSMENLAPYVGRGLGPAVLEKLRALLKHDLDRRDLQKLRARWPGSLVVKGILGAMDAVRALDIGADAIWVSNHGGRQLDCAPAPLDCLPHIKDVVGDRAALCVDGGVRSGEDVVKAGAAGADMAFSGRSLLYALAAGGSGAGGRVLTRFRTDVQRTLTQIGCPSFGALDGSWRWEVESHQAPQPTAVLHSTAPIRIV